MSTGAVVEALLRFAEEQASTEPVFCPNPQANALLLSDPFAFLLAVICDQGIPAERAWTLPYTLRQRLGHLDLRRIAADPDAVAAAIRQTPALHRYTGTVPGWIVAAARRVLAEYRGDAAAIWNDNPAAADLQRRLQGFLGIGRKKAAMAVEILERDLHVPVRQLQGSDVAYDIHIRRVFLRTGLAERDDLSHIIAVARAAYPSRPGAIDLPAWLVGRQWCRPAAPDCPTCPLTSACPKLIDRGAAVRGV